MTVVTLNYSSKQSEKLGPGVRRGDDGDVPDKGKVEFPQRLPGLSV